jgi:protein involved in polysaccharide export with SLBB domain
VEGLTVSGVEALLQQQYSVYYKSPNVDVALLDVGRGQVLIVTPAGRTTLRTFNNGQTLYEVLGSFMSDDLRYRFAYVIRGGYDLFRSVTRRPVSFDAPAMPPAEAGVLDFDTGMGTREQLRLDALLARPDVQSFKVDIAQLTRAAQLEQNIELRAGDIVFLTYGEQGTTVVGRGPKLVQLVVVPPTPPSAGVLTPPQPLATTYGLLPGETLGDLLRLAGFEESPELDLRNVLIERHDASGQLRRIVANLDPASSDLDLSTVQLAHRDTVRIVPYVNQVFVVGSVRTAGAFAFNPMYKALDYITLAGGPTGDAHLRFVKLLRPQRTVGLREQQTQMFNVDLGRDLKGQGAEGYSIVPGDIIFVPSKGYEPSIRDVTSAMSSLFLGINFFEDLVGTNGSSSGN